MNYEFGWLICEITPLGPQRKVFRNRATIYSVCTLPASILIIMQIHLILLNAIVFLFVSPTESVGRPRSDMDDTENLKTTLWIIFWIFSALFIPAILSFIYSVVTDPLTPQLMDALWDAFKTRLGYLGKSSQKSSKKQPRKSTQKKA
eukprot:gene5761-11640_t